MALRGISLDIPRGSFVGLMGRSGSGKTTLLNMIGGLDQPTTGEISVYGQPLSSMSQERLTLMRRKNIGFIFQSFALLPILSAWENVELPLRIAGVRSGRERRQRAEAALALVGLERWATHRPADEPTGELDSTTGRNILQLLREIVRTEGLTLVMVSHDPTVREFADTIYELRDGQLMGNEAQTQAA
jgi:ABC-type lipoprotein export system ATPase subunit